MELFDLRPGKGFSEAPPSLSLVRIPGPLMARPIPVPQDQYTPLGFIAATLTIASAATIGANLVDVRNGTMSKGGAVVNGLVKGAVVTMILSLSDKNTPLGIGLTATGLACAGYVIDRTMKKNRDKICEVPLNDHP